MDESVYRVVVTKRSNEKVNELPAHVQSPFSFLMEREVVQHVTWYIRVGWAYVHTVIRDEADDSVIGVEIMVCPVNHETAKWIGGIVCLSIGPGGAYVPLSVLDDPIAPSGFCFGNRGEWLSESVACELAQESAKLYGLRPEEVHVSRWENDEVKEVAWS